MEKNEIELIVSNNGSPNYTLMQKSGQAMPQDLEGPLFMNSDRAEFYRAVAQRIAKLAAEGWSITYKDVGG